MNLTKKFHWIIYSIFIFSCARQSAPTGGPKDTIPPILISSNPKHEQLNFKGKTIELEFSEYISLNNAKEELIITPSVGKDYEIIAKKQKVILKYETDLKDSTTYTFNFREAVQDITERNPAKNLNLAVSTGNYIDSLSISGFVLNLRDERPLNDIIVAVEPLNDTFSIFKHPATYFTKTDEKGNYKLDNLKPGLYNIYAIGDQNKNLIADSKSESYGFKKDSLLLDNNIEKLKLTVLKLDARPLKVISARPYNTYFNIRTTKNLRSFQIKASDSSELFYAFGQDHSNIQLYNTLQGADSLQVRIIATDSIQNKIDTLFYARFSKEKLTPEKFDVQLADPIVLADKGLIKMALSFSKPLKEVNFDSLTFQIDSVNKINFEPGNLQYSELTKQLKIEKKVDPKIFPKPLETLVQGSAAQNGSPEPAGNDKRVSEKLKTKGPGKTEIKNKLTFGKGAFIGVENDSSTQITRQIPSQRFEDLGVIIAEIKGSPKNIIIELTDTKQKVIARSINKALVTFEDLQPQDYHLRVIKDKNGNGEWDPGNYLKKEEPEEIIYWKDEKGRKDIKLKANFELGPLLISY